MSACAPTDRIMQTITVEAPGAPEAIIQLQLFNVMDEFFKRTNAWRYATDITVEPDTYEYGLALPADTALVRVLGVTRNGVPVPATPAAGGGGTAQISQLGVLVPEQTFSDGDASFAPVESDLVSGIFTYAIYRPEYITITGPKDEEAQKYPFSAVMALTINKSCLECDCADWGLPDWMYDMFFQDFVDGTLARLMAMINKPWSNTTIGAYHSKRFRNAMAYRSQEARRGFTFNRQTWRFPGDWARR
jgi:hypothetical protein